MSEGIIDILMHDPGNSATFIASDLVDYVELNVSLSTGVGFLQTIDGRGTFRDGEKFIILSMGVLLPFSFQFWNDDKYQRQGIDLFLNNSGGSITTRLPRLGYSWIPFESYEWSVGMFFDNRRATEPVMQQDFEIRARFYSDGSGNFARISMLNIPEDLVEKQFYAPIFAKVLHTYPLTAVPS